MPIPTELTIPVTTLAPNTLFLCEQWATATTDDGHKLELDKAGGSIIFTVINPDGERVKQKIRVEDLVLIWARQFGIDVGAESQED